MGFFDRARETVRGKTKEVTAKLESAYRERLGEELENKKNEIERMDAALESTMKEWAEKSVALAKREAELERYYLIPKGYVRGPLVMLGVAAILYAGFLASEKIQSLAPVTTSPVAQRDYKPSPSVESDKPSIGECMSKGRRYYMGLGSYPTLSSGEKADYVIHSSCLNSNGMAFGS